MIPTIATQYIVNSMQTGTALPTPLCTQCTRTRYCLVLISVNPLYH